VADAWSKEETRFDAGRSSGCQAAGTQQALCNVGTLMAGKSVSLTIVLDVYSLYVDYPLINFIRVSGRQKDPTPEDTYAKTRTAIQ
jgi:hypothetical protein